MSTKISRLTDKEAAIIKFLLSKKYSNKLILEIVNNNRDEGDSINSGRISNIKNGQLKKFENTPPATAVQYEQFLKERKCDANSNLKSPISGEVLRTELPVKSIDPLILDISETSKLECKESFSKSLDSLFKPICALANNKGGYILYGVEDKSWKVKGLNQKSLKKFNEWDMNKLDGEILKCAGKQVKILKKEYDIEGVSIGVLYVEEAVNKPLISLKEGKNDDGTDYQQGTIYFRNNASSRLISAQNLNDIVEERARNLFSTTLLRHIEKIIEIGPDNAAVLNTIDGEIEGKSGNLLIDEGLLSQVQFIKEGEFLEKKGAPTLKLVGAVENINYTKVEAYEKSLDLKRITEMFLKDELKTMSSVIREKTSFECIKQLSLLPNKVTPLFYFIGYSGENIDKIKEFISSLKNEHGKEHYIGRSVKYIEDPVVRIKKHSGELDYAVKNGQDISIGNKKIANEFMYTVGNLDKSDVILSYCRNMLSSIVAKYWSDREVKSNVLYTCACLDVLFYKN